MLLSSRVSFVVLTVAAWGILPGCSDGGDAGKPRPASTTRPAFSFMNPIAKAAVGDYAIYRMPDRKTLRYEVMGANHLNVVGPVTVLEEQRDTEVDELLVHDLHEFRPNQFLCGFKDFQVVKLESGTIDAGGRSWDCVAIDVVSMQLGHVRSWYSSDAPVLGLVRRERLGPDLEVGLVLLEIEEWSGK